MARIEREKKKVSLSCGKPVLSDTYPCDFKSIKSGYETNYKAMWEHLIKDTGPCGSI
jgi:hypothetical protein